MSATSITIKSHSAKWRLSGFVLLAILGAEIYYLVHDIAPKEAGSSISLAPIGELVAHQNTVRIQDPGHLVWNDTRDKQILYRRQTLLTLDRSNAEVAFLDGTGLLVGENSMIQLEKNPSDETQGYQKIVVTLLRGTLKKRAPRKDLGVSPVFEIKFGNATATIPPTSELAVSVGPELSGNQIVIHSGEVPVQTPEEKIIAKTGEEIKVTANTNGKTSLVARKPAFDLLYPTSGETIFRTLQQVKVKFQWNVDLIQSAEGALQLEASPDPQFNTGIIKTIIGASHPPLKNVQASLALPCTEEVQNWYWRVRSLNNDTVSRTEQFQIQTTPKPLILIPRTSAPIQANQSLDFVWRMPGETTSDSYELELKLGSTEAPPKVYSSKSAQLHLGPFEPGVYFWRVRGLQTNGSITAWSDVQTFQIVDKIITAPPPPPSELMDAEILPKKKPNPRHTKLDRVLQWLVPAAFAEESVPTYQVNLKWSSAPGAARYKVQIGRQSSFKTILAEAETTEAKWSWPYQVGMENSKGRVFYRVASIDEAGRVGKFSAPKAITIPKSILNASEVYGATEPEPIIQKRPPIAKAPPQESGSKTVTKPTQTSSATIATMKTPPLRWQIKGGLFGGYGSMKQNSEDAGLASVHLSSPFVQQKVQAGFQIAEDQGPTWRCDIQLGFAGFKQSETQSPQTQPFMKAYKGELVLVRKPASTTIWKLGWGVLLDRSFRWVKASSLTLGTEGAFSIGPALSFTSDDEKRGISLRLPLTGAATGGAFGARGSLWNQWRLTQFDRLFLDFQIAGEADYLRWSDPTSTGIYQWTLWGGLIVRLDSDVKKY